MKKITPESRIEIMQPNEDRNLAERGQSPQDVRDVARQLLGEASFATALFEPSTAVSLSRVSADSELWRFDEQVSRALFAHSSASRVTVKRSLMAPILRRIAKARLRELVLSVGPESRDASCARMKAYRTWEVNPLDWETSDTWKESPLEIALSSASDPVVLLTPDQFRACGLIELVRAAGRVLGSCDGDALADDFMRLVIDTCDGEKSSIPALNGGFIEHAQDVNRKARESLDGPSQLLAVTVLAAWLRMSHLGARLSSLDRLSLWGEFFDGQRYGARPDLVGEGWALSDEDSAAVMTRMHFRGPYKDFIPWREVPGGIPLVFAGLAAELLRLATNRCGILDQVSEAFDLPEPGESWDLRKAKERNQVDPQDNRILLQLRERHSSLVGQPVACCYRVQLFESLVDKPD